MLILNKEFLDAKSASIPVDNRGTFYGDGVFETIRCFKGKALFFEDHYFRLMSSMRILRMEIPNFFTPEFLEDSIESLLQQNNLNQDHARIRITVWRKSGGFYTPERLDVNYAITCSKIEGVYTNVEENFIDLFKDHFIYASMLSNLKTTNKAVNILAGIFAQENSYNDLLLLNQDKMIVESISGNLFLRKEDVIKTPPLSDGCLNGIMRAAILKQLKKMLNYTIIEETITPFELQRADELFTTNTIRGIQSITKYRKKRYVKETAEELIEIFNASLFD